jgi:hypothetical protein
MVKRKIDVAGHRYGPVTTVVPDFRDDNEDGEKIEVPTKKTSISPKLKDEDDVSPEREKTVPSSCTCA